MAIDVSPRFTVSLRGYDKDEVEHYLESMSERSSQADDQLYELQEQARFFEDEHERLSARVEELESAIRTETPHSVGALGERITLILNEAEEGAADTLSQARATAEYLVAEAQKEADALQRQASISAAQAIETLTASQRQAEELAERLEAEARSRAAAIVGDAELRAQRRQDQIEGWAQEVISRTQSEQARLVEEFGVIRRRHDAEVRALLGEREDAVGALRSLQAALSRAVDRLPANRLSRIAAGGADTVAPAKPTGPWSAAPSYGPPSNGAPVVSATPIGASAGATPSDDAPVGSPPVGSTPFTSAGSTSGAPIDGATDGSSSDDSPVDGPSANGSAPYGPGPKASPSVPGHLRGYGSGFYASVTKGIPWRNNIAGDAGTRGTTKADAGHDDKATTAKAPLIDIAEESADSAPTGPTPTMPRTAADSFYDVEEDLGVAPISVDDMPGEDMDDTEGSAITVD